jgi:hypothetical protein
MEPTLNPVNGRRALRACVCNTISNTIRRMATRTVRLDPEAESVLQEVRRATGLPISEVLKQGLRALQEKLSLEAAGAPFAIFAGLDLGPGGYAIAPSTDTRAGVRAALRRKHQRG